MTNTTRWMFEEILLRLSIIAAILADTFGYPKIAWCLWFCAGMDLFCVVQYGVRSKREEREDKKAKETFG